MDSGLCTNCKIFFGNQEGLCSKCFKDARLKKTSEEAVSQVLSMVPAIIEEAKQTSVPSSDRCNFCPKKLGPINFKCKCGLIFCNQHRLPEEHRCTYDYKALGMRKLSEENPLVQGEKFNKL
jgi:predicted nucleic acid binding AN1-type Zn finger protein